MRNWLILLILSLSFAVSSFGQTPTIVQGQVTDAETGEPLSFVNIAFSGTTIGTTTDIDGFYTLESSKATELIEVSYLGYETMIKNVKLNYTQTINFELVSSALNLEEVTVKAKKKRYRKKNNPAVELIRKVIKNKSKNSIEAEQYYSLNKYEKIQLDMNNISEDFMNKRAFKKFDFIFDYVDTSEVNGKTFLPFFMQETASDVYYRKKPKRTREYRKGFKNSGLDKYIDDESINLVLAQLYEDVDINNNDVILLTQIFTSPLSILAPEIYRFYIIDTIQYNGQKAIDLAFIPRNKTNLAFTGNMYIPLDSTWQVAKVELSVRKEINLNFVKDLRIEQDFAVVNGRRVKTKEKIFMDFGLSKKGRGFFGKRTVHYMNHSFEPPEDLSVFDTPELLTILDDESTDDPEFWQEARPETLDETEAGIYHMIDTLFKVPVIQRVMKIGSILLSGYAEVPPFEIGPIAGFYSFNDVEGFRLRFGGRTGVSFAKKFQLEGFAAYGFKDREFKYAGSVLYSFNKNHRDFPRHHIKFAYQHDTNFPGQILQFVTEDNFFLSFKRGVADQMLFFDSYKLDYLRQFPRDFTFGLNFESRKQRPLGSLSFEVDDGSDNPKLIESIQTTTFGFNFQWAPNSDFFNGQNNRILLYSKYPVFDIEYKAGIKDFLGGEHNFHLVNFHMFKRFRLSLLGFTYMDLDAGKIWGKRLPYILTFLPRANQTYAYQIYAYNMMNFLEFASDTYASINVRHFFNGFFFNRIPLFKRLKLREVVTAKVLWGTISDANNPEIDPTLIQFSKNADGQSQTYSLNKPYIEASIGVANIFKIVRVDVVKRFTHLDHPNIPKLFNVRGIGLRVRMAVEF